MPFNCQKVLCSIVLCGALGAVGCAHNKVSTQSPAASSNQLTAPREESSLAQSNPVPSTSDPMPPFEMTSAQPPVPAARRRETVITHVTSGTTQESTVVPPGTR